MAVTVAVAGMSGTEGGVRGEDGDGMLLGSRRWPAAVHVHKPFLLPLRRKKKPCIDRLVSHRG